MEKLKVSLLILIGVMSLIALDLYASKTEELPTYKLVIVKKVSKPIKKQMRKNEISHSIQDIEKLINIPKMAEVMSQIEASGRKYVISKLGYLGLYQIGVAALEDLGYVKKGEYKRMLAMKVGQKEFVEKHIVWVKGMSREKFLKFYQHKAFRDLCVRNLKILKKKGLIVKNDIRYIRGLLFASHLIGANGVYKMFSNIEGNYKDANGVSAIDYFKIGYNIA